MNVMQEQAVTTLKSSAPWRQGIGWPIVAAEGLILLVIGGYILIDQEGSSDIVRQLLGLVLLGSGLADVFTGFRRRDAAASPFRILRGGVGITAGTFVVFEDVSDYLDPDTSRVILAFGFLAFGLIGFVAAIAARNETGGLRLGALVSGALAIALSIVLFTGNASDSSRLNLFATIFVVFGVLLLGYAYMLFRSAHEVVSGADAAPLEADLDGSEVSAMSVEANDVDQPAAAMETVETYPVTTSTPGDSPDPVGPDDAKPPATGPAGT
jgi:uncharacterized membrane protein HdeD (DUF308 family)